MFVGCKKKRSGFKSLDIKVEFLFSKKNKNKKKKKSFDVELELRDFKQTHPGTRELK